MNLITYDNVNSVYHGRSCVPMFDVKKVNLIKVRTEGICNWVWSIIFLDGTKLTFDSCDNEHPLWLANKEEHIVSDELYNFLFELPLPRLKRSAEEFMVELEYTLFYRQGKQFNYMITLEKYHD